MSGKSLKEQQLKSSTQSTSMSCLLHCLFLLVLLPLPSIGLYSGDTDFPETSGVELQNEAHVPDQKWLSVAKQLRIEVLSARDEQFKTAFGGTRNMTEFAGMRIETPQLSLSDRCLRSDFNAQKCLQRIYSGLLVYQVHFAHLEQESQPIANLVNIKLRTTRLLHLIKETVNVNEEKVYPTNTVFTDSVWNQKITTHSILYNFADFMTDVSRAINYMKIKKLTKQEWISKHQQ